MCSQDTLNEMLRHLCEKVRTLLGTSMKDVILFGSYARNDADEESDIDVMILADLSRSDIAALNWRVGEITGDLLLEYGILVSPIIENRAFFLENTKNIPFFRNVQEQGVRISA